MTKLSAPRAPLRVQIAQDVLECAKDAGDVLVANAARRCLTAWRLGQKPVAADSALVYEFAA